MRLSMITLRRCWSAGLLTAGAWLATASPAAAFYWPGWPNDLTQLTATNGGSSSGGTDVTGGGTNGGSSSGSTGGSTGTTGGSTGGGSGTGQTPNAPEPATLALGLLGVGTVLAARRRKR
jgi:PEP-CTERM motif